jgi:hypothetical protein
MNDHPDRGPRSVYSPPAPVSRLSGREAAARAKALPADEALIVDARCQVRPAQQVEDKLLSLLKSVFVPVSHVRLSGLCKERGGYASR